MTRSCKFFWYPWICLMLASAIMIGAGGGFTSARAQSPSSMPMSSSITKTTTTSTDSREIAPVVPVSVAAPATPSALTSLLDWLLKLAGLIATTTVTLLLKKYLGTKVNSEVLGQVTELAVQGVAFAEETGHQRIKTGKAKLSGAEKSEIATTYVMQTADRLGLALVASITPAAMKGLTDSQVGATRPSVPT